MPRLYRKVGKAHTVFNELIIYGEVLFFKNHYISLLHIYCQGSALAVFLYYVQQLLYSPYSEGENRTRSSA